MKSKVILSSILNDYEVLEDDKYNFDYEGFDFRINNKVYKSRLGNKTPTKPGYFTTLWFKDENDKNIAYSYDGFCDGLMIIIDEEDKQGLFILDKEVLLKLGILSSTKKGKMGFRVYTKWDINLNKTAQKTYDAMKDYFIDLNNIDEKMLKQLLT